MFKTWNSTIQSPESAMSEHPPARTARAKTGRAILLARSKSLRAWRARRPHRPSSSIQMARSTSAMIAALQGISGANCRFALNSAPQTRLARAVNKTAKTQVQSADSVNFRLSFSRVMSSANHPYCGRASSACVWENLVESLEIPCGRPPSSLAGRSVEFVGRTFARTGPGPHHARITFERHKLFAGITPVGPLLNVEVITRLASGSMEKQCARDIHHVWRPSALIKERRTATRAKAADCSGFGIGIPRNLACAFEQAIVLSPAADVGRVCSAMRQARFEPMIMPGPERRDIDLERNRAAEAGPVRAARMMLAHT